MRAPADRSDGQRVLHAELRIEQVGRLGPVELEAELGVAVHDHAADGAGVGARLLHDLEECVEAGVQAAAAGVGLHAGTVDAELLAEAVQRHLGRGNPGT